MISALPWKTLFQETSYFNNKVLDSRTQRSAIEQLRAIEVKIEPWSFFPVVLRCFVRLYAFKVQGYYSRESWKLKWLPGETTLTIFASILLWLD